MFLFEVREHIEDGFKLVMRGNEALVALGYDTDANGPVWLPLGNSLERALKHPDDQRQDFRLLHARLEEKSAGMVLTAQTREEALAEGKALVLVEGCIDQSLGVTSIAEAYGRSKPEQISYTEDGCIIRRLFVFKPGDAIFISWSAAALDRDYPKRFILSWEEGVLKELPVGRRPRNFRRPRKEQETPLKQGRAPKQQELRS